MRIVGLPGERIDIGREGVLINGTNVSMPQALAKLRYEPTIPNGPKSVISFPFLIPADSYLVLGDNTAIAFDSRYSGPVTSQNILGKVEAR